MAQPISLADLNKQLWHAFVDLDFIPTVKRSQDFAGFCRHYANHQGRHIHNTVSDRKMSDTTAVADFRDYIVHEFLQHCGGKLWSTDWRKRAHLNKNMIRVSDSEEPRTVWNPDRVCQNSRNANRTMFEEVLRSPLGQKMRKYFGLLPGVLPQLESSTKEVMDALLQEIVRVE